jgi:glycosyltransferase involved in cell wall biosynthesis
VHISIALATYNGERFLEPQLASIAAQTTLPAELVVSDDGSTDKTIDTIKTFAKTAPFEVRILEKEKRLGFSDNFLYAAANCRHELVAFSDQDDVWLPDKLRIAHDRIVADGSLLAMHTLTKTDEALNPIGPWNQGIDGDAVFEPLELTPYKTGWGNSLLFHRSLLNLIDPAKRPRMPEQPSRPMTHDTWIYVLADGLGRVSHIGQPLILYRQHGTNTVGINKEGKLRTYLNHQLVAFVVHERERKSFYVKMSQVFAEIARTSDALRERALAAADRYEAMSVPLQTRLDAYESPSFTGRLRAYRQLGQTSQVGTKARVKHFALGVSGLHRWVESLSH